MKVKKNLKKKKKVWVAKGWEIVEFSLNKLLVLGVENEIKWNKKNKKKLKKNK